jgi:hypothetical protein
VESQTKQQIDFIKLVTNRLAKNFLVPLFDLTNEKNYSAQIGRLAEILDWAKEFYDRYYATITNWEKFRYSNDNVYNACTLEDFIISFGKEKLQKFYARNENYPNYFNEKYLAI